MPLITHYLPELTEAERFFIEHLTAGISHEEAQQFATAYRQARKDPQAVLLMAIIGIVAVPGLHRFWVSQLGIGFLFLFTWGLLLVGTISDIVKHKEITLTYNRQIAQRIASNLVRSGKSPSAEGKAFGPDRGLLSQRQHPA